jgi:hypothetical protein
MEETKLGLTTENVTRIMAQALEAWGRRNGVIMAVWPERNGDLRVYLGDQSFVIGEVRVMDARKYRLLFDHEE